MRESGDIVDKPEKGVEPTAGDDERFAGYVDLEPFNSELLLPSVSRNPQSAASDLCFI